MERTHLTLPLALSTVLCFAVWRALHLGVPAVFFGIAPLAIWLVAHWFDEALRIPSAEEGQAPPSARTPIAPSAPTAGHPGALAPSLTAH